MTKKVKDSTPPVLSVKNISKDFVLPHERIGSIKSGVINIFRKRDTRIEKQHALKQISFTIRKGEFFGILGRNGSGKSTLLKILAEIYQPSGGTVRHKGKLVPFIELGVGFNPELTGRENVYLNGALLGFSRAEIDERYEDIVAFAELEEFMDQKLKNYSSGMQVRLAFSVATRAEADILLVDEVLAVGDADFQRKCYDYFKSLKKTGKTVVFVTHDMGAVREYCDRAVLIQDGVITHEGKADGVSNEYLKLFNENSSSNESRIEDESSNRWGNGQVTIKDLNVVYNNGRIILKTVLEADQRGASEYVFGYRFTNAEDRLIMGGSTMNASNGRVLTLKPNSSVRLEFEIDDVFGSGSIDVGATVRLADKVTICDNWDKIASFKATKEESYYPVVAPAVMKEKKL